MIIRSLQSATNSPRHIKSIGFDSVRLLLKDDCMGYSLNVTTIHSGAELHMQYKHHLETCYCVSGKGSITDIAKNQTHELSPGTVYILNKNDRHILRCSHEMVLITIFNPPLNGKELHGSDGSYSLDAEAVEI